MVNYVFWPKMLSWILDLIRHVFWGWHIWHRP